ncbi:dehydrogenase [Streptomyces ruber]|uniref:Dehydrogenase n=2 Tax=Streptomyces TaxID=1883 RepID=A0A918ESV3_9ACTN|nr:NADH-quinone oxidoreductase subunit C [Streptomyces ruber]GGQ62884.1 dehydrogenase [Streptomyces ruber]
MTGWLPAPIEELFGPDAAADESYGVLTVDVPPASWTEALRTARARLGCTYFDWLSAVDEPGAGFRVSAHVVALAPVRRLLLRTTVPHANPALSSAVDIYAGAAWHERETHEMFGVVFDGHPGLEPLLLPENFEGHPLRKDFVLAARVAKAWPGAKEPGESDHGGPKRRQMLPPGVPDPNEWGPLKGQLPPAPARSARPAPARSARPAGDRSARPAGDRSARPAGDRPVRRTRTAAEGSASQTGSAPGTAPVRRSRSASEGSASQRTGDAEAPQMAAPSEPTPPPPAASRGPRRSRSASEGSASQRTRDAAAPGAASSAEAAPPAGPRRTRSASDGSASQRAASASGAGAASGDSPSRVERHAPKAPAAPRSADAPWHHARPAFDDPEPPKPEPTESTEVEESAESAAEAAEPTETSDAPDLSSDSSTPDAPDSTSDSATPDQAPPDPDTPTTGGTR